MTKQMEKAIEVFKNGGIVIFPTDTAIGVGCRIDSVESVKRVFDIKKRNYNKPLLALVSDMQMAKKYVSIPKDVQDKILNVYWPGGLTVFLKCDLKKVPSIVRSGTDALAIRLPDHKNIRSIIKKVGMPILATSANFSGDRTSYSIAKVDKELLSKVDFVLNGECTYKKESTIIDCTVKPWKIIREGAIKIEGSKFKIKNIILAIDTADNKKNIVGLKIAGKKYFQTRDVSSNKTQVILPMIEKISNEHKINLKDISAIEVNVGPGSYTGLRVGLTIANALSFALKIPINGKKIGKVILPIYSSPAK
jgi:L-threonylcarbamoyladenylate synthase